jgi:hypothetical protein
MSDNSVQLESLWQKQQTSAPDLALLKKTWRTVKIKQKLYLLLDILAFSFGPLVLFWLYSSLSTYQILFVICALIISAGFTIYLIWLRRLSFLGDQNATADYLQLLKSQYRQNIKIAQASKYSAYIIPVFFVSFLFGAYWFDIFELEKLLKKALWLTLSSIVFLPMLWVWADKRAKRFERDLARLEKMA